MNGKEAFNNRVRREQCEDRRLYRLRTRNLGSVAVYDASQRAFVGMREKFNHYRIDREFHVDNGPPFGTAMPYEALDVVLPPEIGLNESGPTVCFECRKPVHFAKNEGWVEPEEGKPGTGYWSKPGKWTHDEPGECTMERGVTFENKALRAWLQQMEKLYPHED